MIRSFKNSRLSLSMSMFLRQKNTKIHLTCISVGAEVNRGMKNRWPSSTGHCRDAGRRQRVCVCVCVSKQTETTVKSAGRCGRCVRHGVRCSPVQPVTTRDGRRAPTSRPRTVWPHRDTWATQRKHLRYSSQSPPGKSQCRKKHRAPFTDMLAH